MVAINLHQPQHAACRDLAKGHRLTEAGHYHEATAALQRLRTDLKLRGLSNSSWEIWSLLWICHNKFHLGDNQGALTCLHQINSLALNDDPLISCDFHLVLGLINQRAAHANFKSGQHAGAKLKAEEARVSFQTVIDTAFGNSMQLLALNARQNLVNLEGLMAAIDGTSKASNQRILIDAMKVESEIRQWTPPALKNEVTGLTIIADLSRPMSLTLPEVYSLAPTDLDFQGACLAVIGSPIKTANQTWSHVLLEAARPMATKPGQKARGLILGAKMLIDGPQNHLSELGFAYQVAIADVILSLQKEVQRETSITRQLRLLSKNIDDRLGSHFKGRRVFR